MNRDTTGYFGSEADGGYAQYTVIDHRNAGVIDSPLSDAVLATFACSYSTAEGMLSRASVGDGDRGEIKPLLAASYPLADLKEAQTAFIEKSHVGNIVVIPDAD